VKLTEFKKPKLNELDLSSFIGDYGSAGLRTGLGSMMGKNVLSTQDQMVKDQFVKNFTSRAFSGLQSGISSGLVDPTATGMTTSGANIGTNFGNKPVTNPVTPPVTNPVTNPVTPPVTTPNTSNPAPSTDDAGANAFGQMANQLATTKKSPEQIRQEKQAAAAGVAQDQMSQNGQFSKLPTDQFNKTAANARQQKQNVATQNAQDQMSQNGQFSKLPTDQFNKTATTTRQNKQAGATQNAQDQMSPMSKLPADQFNKSASNVRQRKQADAMKPVTKPDNQFKRNSKLKNPGQDAFGQMAQSLGDKQSNFSEGTQFDKLNYLFENILNEISLGKALSPTGKVVGQSNQQQNKQSISQYITNFFKQFMKGVNISDPAVMTRLASLAKELEQTYNKDNGKSVLPKLAELGWSVQHAQAEEEPKNTNNTPNNTPNNPPNNPVTGTSAAPTPTQIVRVIKDLLKGLNTKQKQALLTTLQKELAPQNTTVSVGKQKRNSKTIDPADAQLLATAKKQGKI